MSSLRTFPDQYSLKGRVAFVTGGATGIGQAIACAMADAGADVAITIHRSQADTTEACVRKHGRRYFEVASELSALDSKAADALIEEVEKSLGRIDILVNNAGTIMRAPAEEHSEDAWRKVMSTNLDAVWYLSQAAGRRMVAGRGSGEFADERNRVRPLGSIINIASLLSFQGGITVPGYAASKHGVAGLTKALSNEWAQLGVGVNAIAPGYIRTSNTEPLRKNPERNQRILERIPAGRWGTPEDIAGAAVFLASSAAKYVSGHVLVVDGGWMAR